MHPETGLFRLQVKRSTTQGWLKRSREYLVCEMETPNGTGLALGKSWYGLEIPSRSCFLFSTCFAFHAVNFKDSPLVILKWLLVVGHRAICSPVLPSIPRKSSAVCSYWICSGTCPRQITMAKVDGLCWLVWPSSWMSSLEPNRTPTGNRGLLVNRGPRLFIMARWSGLLLIHSY